MTVVMYSHHTSEPGIYRVSKGVYEVRVEGERGSDGKRYYIKRRVRGTIADAKRLKARLKLEQGKVTREARTMTVSDVWDELYWPSCGRLARSTRRGYESSYRRHVEPALGDVRMCDLDRRRVQQWVDGIERPGAALSAYKVLRQLCRASVDRYGIIDRDPTRGVMLPEVEPYEPETLDARQLAALLEAVRGTRVEPMVLVMCGCGARREEACALMWEDLSFVPVTGMDGDERVVARVRIDKTILHDGRGTYGDDTKTPRSRRIVTVDAPFAGRLRELSEAAGGSGPMIPGPPGEDELGRENPDRVSREYKRVCRDAGVRYVPAKNLRHTCATLMRDAGVDATVIAEVLGHTTTAMVYQHYFGRNSRAMREASASLGRMLGGMAHNGA